MTGKALSTVSDVLKALSAEANKADNKEKGVEDLQIILEQVKSLKNEFYATANVDYAGRYVFTGIYVGCVCDVCVCMYMCVCMCIVSVVL